jgi:hypothetical protein
VPYDGIYANNHFPRDTLIAMIVFEYVPQQVYDEAVLFPKAQNQFVIFENYPIMIKRYHNNGAGATFYKEYPANFIRKSADEESANCKLVWGDANFESCIFVQTCVELEDGEELKLFEGGLSAFEEEYFFAKAVIPKNEVIDLDNEECVVIPVMNHKKTVIEKQVEKVAEILEAQSSYPNGFHIRIANVASIEIIDMLKSLYGEQDLTVEKVLEKIKESATLQAYYVCNGDQYYECTSANGLCFFSSLYQTKLTDLGSKNILPFPVSKDYIDTFKRLKQFVALEDTLSSEYKYVLKSLQSCVNINLAKLEANKTAGFKWGEINHVSLALSMIPLERGSMYYYNVLLKRDNMEFKFESGYQVWSILKRLWCIYGSTSMTFQYFELKIELAKLCPIFYDNSHFWSNKESLNVDVDTALYNLAKNVYDIMVQVGNTWSDTSRTKEG